MKDKLEVGMYVRTKGGNIFKIIGGNVDNWEIDIDYSKLEQTEENWLELYRYNDNYSFFNDKDIIKASHNIIELIKIGDYVNGYKVVDIKIFSDGNKYVVIATEEHQSFWKDKVFEEDIKSIVTKEQFESMSYKVGDSND